jgi:hypothetical protein
MKKHQNLYILGAVLVLVGGYMYMAKNKAKETSVAPPMVAEDNATPTTPAPTPATTGTTLTGASQVIDSIKNLIAEIKTKSQNAVKPITNAVV